MRFELYKDKKKEWRWRLVAVNGQIMADSAEGYKRKYRAKGAIDTIVRRLSTSSVPIR